MLNKAEVKDQHLRLSPGLLDVGPNFYPPPGDSSSYVFVHMCYDCSSMCMHMYIHMCVERTTSTVVESRKKRRRETQDQVP